MQRLKSGIFVWELGFIGVIAADNPAIPNSSFDESLGAQLPIWPDDGINLAANRVFLAPIHEYDLALMNGWRHALADKVSH